jgi:hypothetical protein
MASGFTPEQQAYIDAQAKKKMSSYSGGLMGAQKSANSGKATSLGGLGGIMGFGMLGKLAGNQGISSLSKFAQKQAGLQRDYVTEATGQAQQSLMEGFRRAYAQRAAGIAGAYGLQADQLGSEMLGQGLSADIARRMMAGQRGASLQQLGEAQGGLASGMFDNLARLQKGTGGELAAISQAETEQYLAPHIAKMSADAAKSAGRSQGLGAAIGGLLGAI